MTAALFSWVWVCVGGIALSLRSARVLGARSRWTIAGWLGSALYFATAALSAIRKLPPPAHLDYAFIALLTLAFVIAGTRDEPQADPWWWPVGPGATGRERRARRDARSAQDERDGPV